MKIRRRRGRMEIELPNCLLRTEGDATAVAYPGVRLVEHGNWGEAIRQMADTWLPWLPQRTNEELARWFDVRPVGPKKARLRLVPPGCPDGSKTYIEVGFSKSDGLPRRWESYLDGKPTARLRFSGKSEEGEDDSTGWQSVVLEDASGEAVVRWELADSAPKAEIADLGADREGYVKLDWRSDRLSERGALARALQAMRDHKWPQASSELSQAAKACPDHPLLIVLSACCFDRDPRLGSRNELLEALRGVVRDGAVSLTRFLAGRTLAWIEPRELYDLLLLSPQQDRRAVDWDHLAQAAADVGLLSDALQHVESALACNAPDGRFEREKTRVELLLRLDRHEEAVRAAKAWAENGDPTSDQLASMGESLASRGQGPVAEELFNLATGSAELSPMERFNLLCRQAAVKEGVPRWRTLLEAAQLQPARFPGRLECMSSLIGELVDPAHAEIAMKLADETEDLDLQTQLLIRQAELTADMAAAADISWQLYQSDRLPADRFDWACETWNQAKMFDKVIDACETRLRSGRPLSEDAGSQLVSAYQAAGCPQHARRASTNDPRPEPPASIGRGEVSPFDGRREASPFGPALGGGMF